MDYKKIIVAGTGNIGSQIVMQCALSGHHTSVIDRSPENVEGALDNIRNWCEEKNVDASGILGMIHICLSWKDLPVDSDILIECLPEREMTKKKFFRKAHSILSGNTVFTTNSSIFIPSMFADISGRPGKFCAMHFHAPQYGACGVDIMPHNDTEQDVIYFLRDFVESIGLTPYVLKKEHPGYVYNSLLNSMNAAAFRLYLKGVADIPTIDSIWKENSGMRFGPFEIMDIVGLDVVLDITRYQSLFVNDGLIHRIVDLLRDKVNRGELGRKSGKGFYDY